MSSAIGGMLRLVSGIDQLGNLRPLDAAGLAMLDLSPAQ
jgi:hypothetical protein